MSWTASQVCSWKVKMQCLLRDTRADWVNLFVDDATIANLATELPLYLAAADGVICDSEEEKLVWLAAHRDTLPNWVALVRKLLLIQPSSVAAERVFSVLSTL